MLTDLFHLFYPHLCIGCETVLLKNEDQLCTTCNLELPETQYNSLRNNNTANLIRGKTPFEEAFSLYHYRKAGRVQNILKSMKYGKNPELCQKMGARMAHSLQDQSPRTYTHLVPLPLHPKRLRSRGYNQSEEIAKGFASVFNLPIQNDLLKRVHNNTTQTSKSRWKRQENVQQIFQLNPTVNWSEPAHFLVIDDVITTGATLEACCIELNKIPNVQISIATFAVA